MTGLRDWYYPVPRAPAPGRVYSWLDVLGVWPAIELDLHERYGVDAESGVLEQRTWRWLALRIGGLVSTPGTRTYNSLTATEGSTP